MAESEYQTLETTLQLLQVQQLARRGRLREAIALLAPNGVTPTDPMLLQTMAALTTGRGDYRAALPLWRQLLAQDPANAEARRMIQTIELWQRRAPWMPWFWPGVSTVGVALLVVVLLYLL